jgi:hypothetical protein
MDSHTHALTGEWRMIPACIAAFVISISAFLLRLVYEIVFIDFHPIRYV